MLIGLIADIHEDVDSLRMALGQLREEGVQEIVVLGDLFEDGSKVASICSMLDAAGARSIWGNHDFGIAGPRADAMGAHYSPDVLRYLSSMQPTLEVEGCLCSHIEPWLDPNNLAHLWRLDGYDMDADRRRKIFDAVAHRVILAGHYHRWMLVTQNGKREWDGKEPTTLVPPFRYFVVIHALKHGWFATLDTETWVLTPLRIGVPA